MALSAGFNALQVGKRKANMQPKSPEYVSKFRDKVRELYEWAWDNQRDAAGNVGTVRMASPLGSVAPTGTKGQY